MPDAEQPQQPEYGHLVLAAQYENMRRLGRDIPFGVSLILNGHWRDILGEGQHPLDWFTDLP